VETEEEVSEEEEKDEEEEEEEDEEEEEEDKEDEEEEFVEEEDEEYEEERDEYPSFFSSSEYTQLLGWDSITKLCSLLLSFRSLFFLSSFSLS
jgi:hypothetical protein